MTSPTVAEAREALARVAQHAYPDTFAHRIEDLVRAIIAESHAPLATTVGRIADALPTNEDDERTIDALVARRTAASRPSPAPSPEPEKREAGGAGDEEFLELVKRARNVGLQYINGLAEPWDDMAEEFKLAYTEAHKLTYDAGFAAGESAERERQKACRCSYLDAGQPGQRNPTCPIHGTSLAQSGAENEKP